MKNFSTWMLVMVMVMFWVFRVIVAVMPEFGTTLGGIAPLNQNLEIILSFVVLVCIVLIVRRKLIGALIYLLAYGMYFGVDVINNIQTVLNGASMETALNVFISIIGIILPIAVLADLLLDKGRKANPKDKKTDWFYNNEQFDRKLDERSDKNNYRTL
ncbi:unknown [Clostridium sp. CAG:440]|jgi:hypothetical protein|nr:unknown [Clostridium sp. CAG:440]HJJ15883.1 hypothetical protein [Clostridiaceae bacterium]